MTNDSVDAINPIHPFPARMAPEIALEQTSRLPPGSTVLDPMSGSGTVLRSASECGHRALGFDSDPLAVLMSRVWTTPLDTHELRGRADELVQAAQALSTRDIPLPWIDKDAETQRFVDYWFAKSQREDLRRLSVTLRGRVGVVWDALRIALSRLIITKEPRASLARDTSHSRPHKVIEDNEFDVMMELLRSAEWIARRLEKQPPQGQCQVRFGDARRLFDIAESSIDAAISSPPYLNAIDYLRGHRLSLVWFGYRLSYLRRLRADAIGSERSVADSAGTSDVKELVDAADPSGYLSGRDRRMVQRYALDMLAVLKELHRVLRPAGKVVLVVGNSCLRGVFVANSDLILRAAEKVGLRRGDIIERTLPPSRRYLPPPGEEQGPNLNNRMRTETVLTFSRP